jgi:hypothetical protein
MSRRGFGLGVLLAGAALHHTASGWISPPVASAAPGFRYLIPPMATASSSVGALERHSYAEKLEARLTGKLSCDLSNDEYFNCRPDHNTEVVQLSEEVKADMRQLVLSVNSKTPHGGHRMRLGEYGCPTRMALGRCVASAIDKFSIALADHRDNCHLPGKICE